MAKQKNKKSLQKKPSIKSAKEAIEISCFNSDELLLKAQKVANMGFLTWDFKTNAIYWSDEVYRLYGIDRKKQKATFKLTLSLVYPDDRAFVKKSLDLAVKGKKKFDIDHRVVRSDGKIIWVHTQAELVRKKGKNDVLLGTVIDITDRKKLDERSKLYQRGLESSPNSMVLAAYKDRGVHILHVNNGFIDMYGYQKREVIDKNPNILKSGIQDTAYYKMMWKALLDPKIGFWKDDIVNKRKDGSLINVILTISTIFDKNNKPRYFTAYHIDISERKKIEGQLKESEKRLAMTQKVADIGSWDWDIQRDELIWNDKTYIQYGLKPNEITPSYQAFEKLVHPDDLDRVNKAVKKAFEGKEPYSIDFRIISKGGREWIMHAQGTVYRDKKGKPIRFVGIQQDITDRKKTEEALMISDMRFKESQSIAHVGSWHLDIVNNKLTWSDEIYKIFGLKPQEFGATYEAFLNSIHPDDRKMVNAAYINSLKNKKPYDIEHRVVLPNGKERIVHERCDSVWDKKGNPISSTGSVQDITERKRAEEALKESEIGYKTLYELSRDAIMTLAPPSWQFTSGNPSTVKMFNCKDEKDFISRGPWAYSPEVQPDGTLSAKKAKAMIMKAMEEGSNFFEWTHKKWNGDDFPATVLLTRMTVGDKTFLQATVRDITDQKKAEEEIKKSESLYKLLVDGLPYCIKLFDSSPILLSINKHGREEHSLEGWSDKQIAKWDYTKCVTPESRSAIADGMVMALKGKANSFTIEHNHNHAKGGYCYSTLIPVLKDKKVQYVIFASADVTDQRGVEKALKEKIKQMELIGRANLKRHKKFLLLKKENAKLKNALKKYEN